MRKFLILATSLLALPAATGASAQSNTTVGVGTGAVTGAFIAGPIGAVVGGVAGGFIGAASEAPRRRYTRRAHRPRRPAY
jgi:outer membrane lipoprotein SlyB